ncbi:MAG: ABC transporter substrate-binding protein [Candidatus Aminicenantia bacterium]
MKSKLILFLQFFLIYIHSFAYQEKVLKIFWPISETDSDIFYDPAGYSFVEDFLILNNLYNGLIKFDSYQRILPDLADFWKISPDRLVYEFKLKRMIKFTNGKTVEAQDFLNSVERLHRIALQRDPVVKEFFKILTGKENCSWEEAKKKITVKSALELEIRLSESYPFFLYLLANPAFKIVFEDKNGKIYGTGPFYLEKLEGRKVVLAKNDSHFSGAPILDKIVLMDYLGIPVEERFSRFQRGEVDIFPSPGRKFFTLPNNSDAIEIAQEVYSFTFLVLNLLIHPFDKKDFRKALFLGINKKRIAEELGNFCIYYPYAVPRKLHRYEVSLPYGEYNSEEAKKIVENIKRKHRIETIYFPIYSETPSNMKLFHLLQEDFSKLGLDLKLRKLSENGYWEFLEKRKFQIFINTYHADLPEAYGILYPLFYSISPVNYSSYSNKNVDRLLMDVLKENNYSKRINLYQEIEKIIYEDVPIIPLFTDNNVFIVRKNIEGFKISYNSLIDTDFKKVRLAR